jgi:hypothetical protein
MGVTPLVYPDKLHAFEEYAYNVAFPQNHYPNTTGIGKNLTEQGVWGVYDSNSSFYLGKLKKNLF